MNSEIKGQTVSSLINLDKRSCLARAKALLATPTHENVRYAALELRICIEALTYEKLRTYANLVPLTVLETWQPPQAVKALLAFEPDADQSFVLSFGLEEEYGKPAPKMQVLGEHKSLPHKWLSKHYNKLGQLLHAPSKASSSSPTLESLCAYMNEVVADLVEPVGSSIVSATFRETFSFECALCKNRVVGNRKTLASTRKATCFHPQCGAEYFADVTDSENPTFKLIATDFECMTPDCNEVMVLENKKMDIGVTFTCPSCSRKHTLVNCEWAYGQEES